MKSNQNNDQKEKRSANGRRAGQVINRGPDKYLIRVYLGRDSNGKRHYHDETFHGKKKAAEERLRTLLTKHKNGEPLRLGMDTLDTFLDEWLGSRPDLKESSVAHYKRTLSYYVRPRLGGMLLTKIEPGDIQSLYRSLDEAKLGRGTINYVHTLLKGVFKLAIRRRKIAFNPMDGVDAPGGKNLAEEKREKRRERVMTPEQVTAFLTAAAETRFGSLFTLVFHTGCRPGELLGLDWRDFDQTGSTLTIRQTINWRSAGEWYLDKPKTAAGRRVLRLTESLIELLVQHRRRQLEERMRAGKAWNDHGFIFVDEIGKPYAQNRIRYFFKQILKAAGLPGYFNPYSARHTSATFLMAAGINAKTISERLGHSDVRITLATYTHPTDGMHDAAGEALETLIRVKKDNSG
jgi:integrase